MSKWEFSEEMLKVMYDQAREEYPCECCGMILGPSDDAKSITRIRQCRNAQDQYHELAPDQFTRTAKQAYFIDPKELLAIDRELRENGEAIRVIYHSHPDVGAYFSEEDVRTSVVDGEPIYPGVDYLVLSVVKGEMDGHKLFTWDGEKKTFVEVG